MTNRGNLLSGLQMLEFSSIIGLVRRAQALGGRVGTVAGVLGLLRCDAVIASIQLAVALALQARYDRSSLRTSRSPASCAPSSVC